MTPIARAYGPPTGQSAATATHRNDALLAPGAGKDARSVNSAATSFSTVKPGISYGRSAGPPGSFASNVTTLPYPRTGDLSRTDLGNYTTYDDGVGNQPTTSEQRQAEYRSRIDKETKIKIGTENLLEALNSKKEKQARDQRRIVETELNTSNRKIAQLKLDLEAEIQRGKEEEELNPVSPRGRISQLFRSAPVRTPEGPGRQLGEPVEQEQDPELESPTYILAEILQALEVEDLRPDYYVEQANDLVELFRRHPTLKYDLAWSIFGLRMQMLLLSDSREVVAAGYRVMRYAITDRKSLQTIRALQTDYLVILSLVKEGKARVEREQALKFIRAFLDVKDGCDEIHPAVARVIVAVADHSDDSLRSIAVLTLAEMLLKDAQLVINAGGVSVLADAMGSGSYHAPEALILPLLHLMDLPGRRSMLRSGFEFSSAFATFTEPHPSHFEERLKASARVIAAMFKSWPGLMTLSLHDFLPVRSVVSSLYISSVPVRTATLDLLIDILRIKSPSWSTTFIGGRRLTTYNRVANLKVEPQQITSIQPESRGEEQKRNLVEHFIAVALAVLLRQGLLKALMHAESDSPTQNLKRKTSLLIAEVLRMASELLPSAWSQSLQAMPGLFDAATRFNEDERFLALATVYQVDSINRTLYRSLTTQPSTTPQLPGEDVGAAARARATSKTQVNATMDAAQFKLKMTDTGVLSGVNFHKWDWPLIQELVEGPMVNPQRFLEALKQEKFVHRLLGFLRPFKFRFSDEANTKSNQRYVRTACSLVKCMLAHQEGVIYLSSAKVMPQLAECLAQLDPVSGITSQTNIFSPQKLSEKLVGGYFTMLGVMCRDQRGIHILIRWKIINMFYHIVELKNRDDLIKVLLTNLDYTLDSHPRIILSKAMIAGSKGLRIAATRMLRKYALLPIQTQTVVGGGAAEWAIRLLVGQLYDPEIEVCEVAIKILEEACDNLTSLEYVVKCRPALDHLGEIGAPLLLRFLSTSVGYHYLDGLDYITKEMDDWFLGRNDTYVMLVEASLARALASDPEKPASGGGFGPDESSPEPNPYHGNVPPHFYRELTRTAEGCELLKAKRHFEEFAATIQDFALEDEDPETILKVKGCLWAVGNVGSMELGAPFLERTGVVAHIVKIAEMSQVMTLRGTAFFVLGLVSRSLHGQEILAEFGWDGGINVLGEGLGYTLPLEFDRLFSLRPFERAGLDRRTSVVRSRPPGGAVSDPDATNAGILASITKLGNTVLTNKALAELSAYKHKKVPGFRSAALFRKAMVVLAGHGYGVQQWRFVCDLWEKGVLRKIVLEEDDDEDEVDSDGEQQGGQQGTRSRSGT